MPMEILARKASTWPARAGWIGLAPADWEVHRGGVAAHVDVAASVDSEGLGDVGAAAAQVGGVDDRGALGIDLGEEGVGRALESGLQGARADAGKGGGRGGAGDVGGTDKVDGDGPRDIATGGRAAAEEGQVDESAAGGVDLGDEAARGGVGALWLNRVEAGDAEGARHAIP